MPTAVHRKLTTILCADVVGYSRMMEADEVATLETLKAYREAMAGFIARHDGRVVSTSGDGLLAEFASVVEAVQCAAEVQRELSARNAALGGERRMDFRIGVNLGDVIVEGDDLYGEGVNIAARLQGLAEPGGIDISGTVYDQVRNKLTLGYEFMGARTVKNISEQVPVYRVQLDAAGESARRRTASANTPPRDG
ncbi:MAG: adenylate/guanylate cyclase domain-containing protein, partial [Rhodospirillales bacterium]|nr:adenylate/guanylate cyclase domain-containing protein [Rhodospirillales bacterium]